jgi:hypothetical protein
MSTDLGFEFSREKNEVYRSMQHTMFWKEGGELENSKSSSMTARDQLLAVPTRLLEDSREK